MWKLNAESFDFIRNWTKRIKHKVEKRFERNLALLEHFSDPRGGLIYYVMSYHFHQILYFNK